MSKLTSIRQPVKEEMEKFESYFKNTFQSDVPLLKVILNYVLRRKGKQMRPLLVFLSAGLNGKINEATYVAATFIELLHTATLVHDDVVDDSNERRGALSINALWNSKIAVLTGDYLLSQGLLISVQKKRYDMLEIVSNAVQSMSKGELLQLQKSRKLDITEDVYFDIIKMKTATLIASCTESGTKSVNNDPSALRNMRELGENIGIAFQIRDDIFDYQNNGVVGKPAGNDIREKKITLPLIHALDQVSSAERSRVMKIIKSKNKSAGEVKKVVNFVIDNGGLDYSSRMMDKYRDKAMAILDTYEDSDFKKAMSEFIDYTTVRHK